MYSLSLSLSLVSRWQVVHATAPSPLGPWTRNPGVTLHVWSHCPNAAVTPDGAILLPRLWCTPRKYPAGVSASCKAGVRRCLADGQCCRDGASPCGFSLHEGRATNCTSKPGSEEMRTSRVRDESSIHDSGPKWQTPRGENTSFVTFPVSFDP